MLSGSQDGKRENRIDDTKDQLSELKRILQSVIRGYILRCDTKPMKVSFFNEAGMRLHYKNGHEGRQRAEAYQMKIDSFTSTSELVAAILSDLREAEKEANTGLVEKATKFLGDGYEYVLATIYSYSGSEMPQPESAPIGDLGTSEVLAGLLAKTLCDCLHLQTHSEEIYNELLRIDKESARLYMVNELTRQINALDDWLRVTNGLSSKLKS